MRASIVKGDVQVAELVWVGGRYTGKGRIRAVKGFEEDAQLIRGTITDRAQLRMVRFTTPRGDTPGWRGFDGWINGLALVLPSIGYDFGEVEWPPETTV